MTLRLRRSELSTPASSPKMMEKAMATAADMVFLDLEDAVAPAQKEAARKNAVDALRNLDWGTKVRAVRVNGADTHWAHDDVIEVVEGAGDKLDVIIVPKPKAPRDIWFFDTLLTQLETKLRFELRKQCVEEPDVARRLRFRHNDDVELVPCTLDDFDHIVMSPVRICAVDAHRANFFAPIEIAERIDSVLARRFLLRRSDRIFKIEEHHVGRGRHRLLHHLGTGSGRRKFGTS